MKPIVVDAPVLHLGRKIDANGDIIDVNCDINIQAHAIPVHYESHHDLPIGSALVRKEGDKLLASFDLDPGFVERARVSAGFCPCIAGYVVKREGNIILKMRLDSIDIFPAGKNIDPTIPNLIFQGDS